MFKATALTFAATILVASLGSETAAESFPKLIDPATDFAAQPPGPELGWADSVYITSRLNADGRDIGILLHVVSIPNGPGRKIVLSATDETTDFYRYEVVPVQESDFHWSADGLNITAPGLTWTGDAERMSISFEVPWFALDLELESEGPVMAYGGSGSFPLFGDVNHEFALPNMRTTGTLLLEGNTHEVVGQTWVDRQWGATSPQADAHWSWISFNMPNGDAMAIWDTVSPTTGNQSWATVVRRDGTHIVTEVEPFAEGASEIWTSPESGNTYPTRWQVRIPALNAALTVNVTGNLHQEIVINGDGRYEATAAFSGTYQGENISGKSYVEMFGEWQ
ncbi:lipocalin family protein [Citreimonas salinaria]|uniref:Hydroxyneurosporene synthase (CrtC) n=1 Tax=Citreimonas salinaria TaxID=321339 RepID=A0A1H3N894_9RHOB|nr:lipocalin family protein [Citreimonas salinaria]SDY85004.1 Hydroxyneurosporene synthase (CrtC) [Citreimonas salinaria]